MSAWDNYGVGLNFARPASSPGFHPGADRGVIIYGNVSGGWVGDDTAPAQWAALKVKVDSLLVSLSLSASDPGANDAEKGKIASLQAQASMLATAVGMAVSGVPNDYGTQLAQYNGIVSALGAINAAIGARKAQGQSNPTPPPAPVSHYAPPAPVAPPLAAAPVATPVTDGSDTKRKLLFAGGGILGAILLSKMLLKR